MRRYSPNCDLQSGAFNQSGSLAPRTSDEGDGIREWMHEGKIWQHATYLTRRGEYRGFLGAFATRGAGSIPAYALPQYGGDAPQSLQTLVDGEDPWNSAPIGGL